MTGTKVNMTTSSTSLHSSPQCMASIKWRKTSNCFNRRNCVGVTGYCDNCFPLIWVDGKGTRTLTEWSLEPILHNACFEQFLEATTALATSDMPCTCNGLLATFYLQHCTCNGNFHLIEIIVASSCIRNQMKAYENLSSMMKTIWKDCPNYQGIASKIFSMLKLRLQTIASNSNVQSQANRK